MGKDKKQKEIAKAKRGLIGWEEISRKTYGRIHRRNFHEIGEDRKKVAESKDEDNLNLMKKEIEEYDEDITEKD